MFDFIIRRVAAVLRAAKVAVSVFHRLVDSLGNEIVMEDDSSFIKVINSFLNSSPDSKVGAK
jgi:hypothetical protein